MDKYCGADPMKQFIHDIVFQDIHYPGCGVQQEICTAYPACDDLITFKIGRGYSDPNYCSPNNLDQNFKALVYNRTSGIR